MSKINSEYGCSINNQYYYKRPSINRRMLIGSNIHSSAITRSTNQNSYKINKGIYENPEYRQYIRDLYAHRPSLKAYNSESIKKVLNRSHEKMKNCADIQLYRDYKTDMLRNLEYKSRKSSPRMEKIIKYSMVQDDLNKIKLKTMINKRMEVPIESHKNLTNCRYNYQPQIYKKCIFPDINQKNELSPSPTDKTSYAIQRAPYDLSNKSNNNLKFVRDPISFSTIKEGVDINNEVKPSNMPDIYVFFKRAITNQI